MPFRMASPDRIILTVFFIALNKINDYINTEQNRNIELGNMTNEFIEIKGAREHNLKDVDISIPKNKLTIITGLSGSGKSSLAFDTVYAEGQRRYVESLSSYARQFLDLMKKPEVDSIEGLSPAISIEQKTTSHNPRSTVGTVTEIYDYMRLLWARAGTPYSPATGLPIESQTVSQMVDKILAMPEGTKLLLLAPIARGKKGEYKKEIESLQKQGYQESPTFSAPPLITRTRGFFSFGSTGAVSSVAIMAC